jgi:hypothetical protein
MSKKAAEHHLKAAEHHELAAQHQERLRSKTKQESVRRQRSTRT